MTAPELLYIAAGSPAVDHLQPHDGVCATSGAPITHGVAVERINNPTLSNHSDFFRFGSHVSAACAWLFFIGKSQPGNIVAAGGKLYRPMIALESAAKEGRPSYLETLREVALLPAETPVAGILTMDTKPRVWPRLQICTVGQFGLFVHHGDYDVSSMMYFDLLACLECSALIVRALELGFSKNRVYHGLLSDYARVLKLGHIAQQLERDISAWRSETCFLPALMISGVLKESNGIIGRIDPAAGASGDADEADRGLF